MPSSAGLDIYLNHLTRDEISNEQLSQSDVCLTPRSRPPNMPISCSLVENFSLVTNHSANLNDKGDKNSILLHVLDQLNTKLCRLVYYNILRPLHLCRDKICYYMLITEIETCHLLQVVLDIHNVLMSLLHLFLFLFFFYSYIFSSLPLSFGLGTEVTIEIGE